MTETTNLLWLAAENALAGEPLPREAAELIASALADHLLRGTSLDEALGLHTPGDTSRSFRVRYMLERRNNYLRLAWNQLDAAKPYKRSQQLEAEIRRFETVILPRWRINFPESPSALRLALFHAFGCRVGVPHSAPKLHKIVTQVPATPVGETVVTSRTVKVKIMDMNAIQAALQRAQQNAGQFSALVEALKRQREELDAMIELIEAQPAELDKAANGS